MYFSAVLQMLQWKSTACWLQGLGDGDDVDPSLKGRAVSCWRQTGNEYRQSTAVPCSGPRGNEMVLLVPTALWMQVNAI